MAFIVSYKMADIPWTKNALCQVFDLSSVINNFHRHYMCIVIHDAFKGATTTFHKGCYIVLPEQVCTTPKLVCWLSHFL